MSESVSHKKSRTPRKGKVAIVHPSGGDGDKLNNEIETAAGESKKEPIKRGAAEYKPEFCEKLLRYFYEPKQKIAYDVENFQSGELKRKKPVLFAPEYPTLARFARQIGVTVPILYEWERRYPEFAEACAEARESQKSCVIVNALNRNFDAGFSKFLLCKKFPEEFAEESAPQSAGVDIRISYGKENLSSNEETTE